MCHGAHFLLEERSQTYQHPLKRPQQGRKAYPRPLNILVYFQAKVVQQAQQNDVSHLQVHQH